MSLFGMYPFSGYPIGVPFLYAVLFWIGLPIESAVFLLSISFCVIGLFGAFKLGNEIFPEEQIALIFTCAYSLSHLFLRVTYSTLPARGVFLAILPWFLWVSVKFLRQKKLQDGILSACLLFTLFLTHGLGLYVSILYLGIIIGYQCILIVGKPLKTRIEGIQNWLSNLVSSNDKLLPIKVACSSKNFRSSFRLLALVLLVLAAYLIGLFLLPIDPRKISPVLMSNDTILGISINLAIDYGLRLGVLSIFMPLGIAASVYQESNRNRRWLHFVLVPILFLTIPLSLYASVTFLPVWIYYSVYGFSIAWRKRTRGLTLLSLLAFTLLYGLSYNLFIVNLPLFSLGLVAAVAIILVGYIGLELANRLNKTSYSLDTSKKLSIIILTIICFSLVTTDGLTISDESGYITEDEKGIISYLAAQPDVGVVFVSNPVIARRLQAYGIIAIEGANEPIGLYLGWITPDQIIENTHLVISIESILNYKLYSYTGEYPENALWSKLFVLDVTIVSDHSIAIENNLDFVLVEKTESGYSDTYSGQYCPLLHSAPLVGELVYEEESLALFRIFP